MAINFSEAISAYANAAKRIIPGQDQVIKSPSIAAPMEMPAFSDFVGVSAEKAMDTLKRGEKVSAAAVVGKADLNDVVAAMTNAELTLQAVVSIRDRVISAYQEILRMPM
jgi:flagellar hook-basal body complex protein FliE